MVPGPDGQDMSATELTFNPSVENWAEVMVEDGTVIRLKLVVTGILKIDDAYDDEGNPVYRVKSQNIMAVSAPEELRRKSDGR